jgi:hypothetical protein
MAYPWLSLRIVLIVFSEALLAVAVGRSLVQRKLFKRNCSKEYRSHGVSARGKFKPVMGRAPRVLAAQASLGL